MVSGGMTCIKYLLFFFNFIFFLVGLLFLILGIIVQVTFNKTFNFSGGLNGSTLNVGGIFLIVVGVIILVVAFFGCCGACKENNCMVMTFAVFLAIILILQIALIIAVFVARNQIEGIFGQAMNDSLIQYNPGNKTASVFWDESQKTFKCCGVDKPRDWSLNFNYMGRDSVPDSCCLNVTTDCGVGKLLVPKDTSIYQEGCSKKLTGYFQQYMLIVGAIVIAVAIVQLIGIICACVLATSIRKEYQMV